MSLTRQEAFQKLRSPCVELSSVGLRFKAGQASVKQVLKALTDVHVCLEKVAKQDALDAKLAEYAFFPLTHIFNESKKLPSPCLEVAARCVALLVGQGWKQNLSPAMGKQLLILMTLLSGNDSTTGKEVSSEDLQVARFDCMAVLIHWLIVVDADHSTFDAQTSKGLTDQVVYLLLEAMMTTPSDSVQIAVSKALSEFFSGLNDHVLLASLLPRTVSALVKVLKASTQAKRTQSVLVEYLNLLSLALRSVLADTVLFEASDNTKWRSALEPSWLKATTPQISIALTYVTRLKQHEGIRVRAKLFELCMMIVDDCQRSLSECLPQIVETLVTLAGKEDMAQARQSLDNIITVNPEISDILKTKVFEWSRALPRILLSVDDRKRQNILSQLSTSFKVLSETMQISANTTHELGSALQNAVSGSLEYDGKISEIQQVSNESTSLSVLSKTNVITSFRPVVLDHQSRQESMKQLQILIKNITDHSDGAAVCRFWIESIPDAQGTRQLSSFWLALEFLRHGLDTNFMLDEFIDSTVEQSDMSLSRAYLVSDLYTYALPFLLEYQPVAVGGDVEWRLVALSLESLALQAQQLGKSYRPELVDTLYPVLSILASPNSSLQNHAIATLDMLAKFCQYNSVSEMLIENVDYLINSVALKLNAFDVSPPAIRVVGLMLKLCGSRLLPYLDDLVDSIFGALDNFHGYPGLVESLFQVLKAMIDESVKTRTLTITMNVQTSRHRKRGFNHSQVVDIVHDLRSRRRRKKSGVVVKSPEPDPKGNDINSANSVSGNLVQDQSEVIGDTADDIPSMAKESSSVSKPYSLLLSIAKAANPHLASPSPQARQTILQMLEKVSPLLAEDENSFLPFINDIWPNLTARLVVNIPGHDNDTYEEAVYNICTASAVIGKICEGAGDFMSSRVEVLVPHVEKLFLQVNTTSRLPADNRARNAEISKQTSITTNNVRTSNLQIIKALTDLSLSILVHLRMSGDVGERVFNMLRLANQRLSRSDVELALIEYNADAVWLEEYASGDI